MPTKTAKALQPKPKASQATAKSTKVKTTPTEQSVKAFIDSVADAQQRADCLAVSDLMNRITGDTPKMWGEHIVGFGNYHYKYESGREGDTFLVGFSPRKNSISLYLNAGFDGLKAELQQLGKHKTSVACLSVKRLSDIDKTVLHTLIEKSIQKIRERYPEKTSA